MYDLPSLTKPISNAVIENVDEWEGNKMVVKKFLKKHAVDKGDYLSMMIVILMEYNHQQISEFVLIDQKHDMKGIRKHQSFKIID